MRRAALGVFAVVLGVLAAGVEVAPAGASTESSMAAPTGLSVDDQTGPGLVTVGDSTPTLSWVDHDSARGQAQSAYQVVVSRAPGQGGPAGTVWDSGRVRGAQTTDVAYRGPALASDTSYVWKVRSWNGDGDASPWSESAAFGTGLLKPQDWSASWIQQPPPPTLEGADWIWYPEIAPGGATAPVATRYFRRTFSVPSGTVIKHATLVLTADDSNTVWINGTRVSASPAGTTWQQPQAVDVTSALHGGTNVLATAVANAGGPAGLVARLHIEPASGDPADVDTDGSWVSAQQAPDGWQQPGFDDSAWPAALVEGAFGSGPWGNQADTARALRDPYLRREFSLDKKVARARLYVAAQGMAEAYLNGAKVGEDVLDPTVTDWQSRVLYRTFDVTGRLHQGGNAIGMLLGQGNNYQAGHNRLVAAQLDVTYADGSTAVIGTDATWLAASSPVTSEDMYRGEAYDARLEQPGWDTAGFDAQGWTPTQAVAPASAGSPKLQADPLAPVKVIRSVAPVKETRLGPGDRVYDFGDNFAGWVRISAAAPAGTTVDIKKGELLDANGHADTTNISFSPDDGVRQTDHYTFRGTGTETYHPHFVYSGFRYAEITGLPDSAKISVVADAVHNAVPTTGTFTSSDPLLNRIDHATGQTIANSLYGMPSSDPTRERHGWTRDAGNAADAAMDTYGLDTFYTKWLDDIVTSQGADGSVSSVAPSTMFGGVYVNDPAWASAYPEVLWSVYTRYGDSSVLDGHYDSLKRYIDYLGTITDADHVIARPQTTWGNDWEAVESTPAALFQTGYYYEDTMILARTARILGRTADADAYTRLAGQIADGFNQRFFHADSGQYGNGTQLSNAMPLMLGIVPQDDVPHVLQALVSNIAAHGQHLTTGYVGTPILLDVLRSNGRNDVVLAMAQQTDYPGVGYMLARGPGTFWEGWTDSDVANGLSNKDHPGLGTPFGDWLYTGLAGIQQDRSGSGSGFSSFTLAPSVVGDLTHVAAQEQTPRGTVASEWSRNGDTLTYRAQIPVGARATVDLPLPGGAGSTVREDGHVIFSGGHAGEADPGLTVDGMHGSVLRMTAGSGRYTFTVQP
ncbi:family 78 glycoside hydrolase catalytic domain [Streptomyces sp. NPDC020917]|uniref:family 78 glycoside hydrolase catalytic domain n=1 Tax=Streptomyces sp. NPDC020917 TaxID=3365102 RepID=UPI00379D15BF